MDAFEGVVDGAVEAVPHMKPSRPVRGFLFDAVMAVVLMLAISLAFMVGWYVVAALAPDGWTIPGRSMPGLLAMTAVGTGGAALAVYAWRRRATAAERAASARAARLPATWGWTVAVAAAVFAFANGAQWLIERAGVEVSPSNLEVIQRGLIVQPAFVLLFATLLAPAYEELLFRRVLFGRLLAAGKPWLGIVLSSAVFALMHEIPGTTGNPLEATLLLWLVYGGMGAAFAWVYWRTGTLWAAFGAHALHNLASVLVLLGGLA